MERPARTRPVGGRPDPGKGIDVAWLAETGRCLRRFLADERGTAGIEFLAASPLLFGVMIFTAEYGEALRYRIALDGAVQDVARYLSRTPVRQSTDAAGNPSIAFYDHFLTDAGAMLDRHVGRHVDFTVDVTTADTANFRTPFYLIDVNGSVTVDLPMLAFINLFSDGGVPTSLTMRASQEARWGGSVPPGQVHCDVSDRYSGTC